MKLNSILASALIATSLLASSCGGDDVPPAVYPPSPEEPSEPAEPAEPSEPEPLPQLTGLHVDGRYLRDAAGNIVNLHGFAQTYSPWFNEQMTQWTNYDVDACLRYNQGLIDKMLAVGWKMDFVRLHMDPYWSNTPGVHTEGEADISAFDMERFRKYLDEVFVPMAEYAIKKGMYVVMRPPGVCPHQIAVGDNYQKYLIRVWNEVAKHPKLRNNERIMFELANEPVHILAGGTYGANTQAHFDELKKYFQSVVDVIRNNGTANILWVPGLAYQGTYWGLANNPIEGENIGYAVHVYPGWMGSDGENGDGGISDNGGYQSFQNGWNAQVQPIADIAPIMITEMDWAPQKYNASWGKAHTGVAGGAGFGANFKYIVDNCGNVSWLLFTSPDLLAKFDPNNPATDGNVTFLNDPEACPWPIYHWYRDYASGISASDRTPASLTIGGAEAGSITLSVGAVRDLIFTIGYTDGSSSLIAEGVQITSSDANVVEVSGASQIKALAEGNATITATYARNGVEVSATANVTVTSIFALTADRFNPSIWEEGSFDEATRTLVTGKYGFGGWKFPSGVDLSGYKYLIVELGNDNQSQVSFRLFDTDNYWSEPAMYDFGSSRRVVIELSAMRNASGNKVDASHIYIAGFWSLGGKPIIIDRLTLTNTAD